MTTDTTHTIHRSASRFLSGTLISRFTGMLRDMAMAFAFGTAPALAAFMVAFRFAHLARRLFGEGSLQNTFIPHFEELRLQNPTRAFAFFRDLAASLLLILAALIFAGMTVLHFLYPLNWTIETKQIMLYTSLMLPSLFFISLYGLNAALLGCEKQFFTSGIAPVAFNLVWIAAAFYLSPMPINQAMIGLSLAVILGCLAQWAVTVPQTLKILPKEGFLFKACPFSPDVRHLIKPLLLANFGVAASQINNALDPLFALFANSEGPAWLWFAIRVQQLPLALFGIALANALIPPIARAIKSGNLEQFHHLFHFAIKRVLIFTVITTAAIFATAPTCVNLLFGRGNFEIESIAGTANCLLGYGIGLFPMAYILIAAPALFAFGDFKTPTKGASFSMLLNIGLNSLFVFGFAWGSPSVALATSLASFWNAHYLSKALNLKNQPLLSLLSKPLCVSLVALLSVYAMDYSVFGSVPALQLLLGQPLQLPQNFFLQVSQFAAEAFTFCAIVGIFFGRSYLQPSR